MKFLTADERKRLSGADRALDRLFKRYRVEIRHDNDGGYFFALAEPKKKPKLKIVE